MFVLHTCIWVPIAPLVLTLYKCVCPCMCVCTSIMCVGCSLHYPERWLGGALWTRCVDGWERERERERERATDREWECVRVCACVCVCVFVMYSCLWLGWSHGESSLFKTASACSLRAVRDAEADAHVLSLSLSLSLSLALFHAHTHMLMHADGNCPLSDWHTAHAGIHTLPFATVEKRIRSDISGNNWNTETEEVHSE